MKRNKKMIGAALAAGALTLGLAAPAVAATGDWHEVSGTSELGLGLEVSYKDTRRGVSVEGIWIHPSNPASVTYTIKGYDGAGNVLYQEEVTGAYGDDCVGTPYEEIPNPNVFGSIVAGTVLVEVSYFGYHQVHGYVSDSVTVSAVRGG